MFKKPKRFVDTTYIHCSASDRPGHDDISVIKQWHTTPSPTDPSKPWSDIGYHFFIKKDGTRQLGRSLERIPAAQAGYNTGSIAICLHGLDEDKFTEAQFKELRKLCREINDAYDNNMRFRGHREVNKYKTCPVFNYRKVLNLDSTGHMVRKPVIVKPKRKPKVGFLETLLDFIRRFL